MVSDPDRSVARAPQQQSRYACAWRSYRRMRARGLLALLACPVVAAALWVVPAWLRSTLEWTGVRDGSVQGAAVAAADWAIFIAWVYEAFVRPSRWVCPQCSLLFAVRLVTWPWPSSRVLPNPVWPFVSRCENCGLPLWHSEDRGR